MAIVVLPVKPSPARGLSVFPLPLPSMVKHSHKNSRLAVGACMCSQTCRMFFHTEGTFEVCQFDSIRGQR